MKVDRQALNPELLTSPGGPFSHGFLVDRMLFLSGQCGLDKDGNVVGEGDTGAQAHQALLNLQAVLSMVGGSMQDIVKLTVFLTDISDRPAVADARSAFFVDNYPASTLVEVSGLADPRLAVEIEAIALIDR